MWADQQASAPVSLPVEVVVWSGSLFRCIIRGREVDIPLRCVQPGTTVHRSGDQGLVVVPTWCAVVLGFAERRSSDLAPRPVIARASGLRIST